MKITVNKIIMTLFILVVLLGTLEKPTCGQSFIPDPVIPSTGGGSGSTGIQINNKPTETSVPEGTVDPDDYKPGELTSSDAGEFTTLVNTIIAVLRIFGTVVSVVALMALGIKYMLGSAQDKATYKETMIPYIVGAVMLFAITNIISVLYDIVTQIDF